MLSSFLCDVLLTSLPFRSNLTHVVIVLLSQCCDSVSGRVRQQCVQCAPLSCSELFSQHHMRQKILCQLELQVTKYLASTETARH